MSERTIAESGVIQLSETVDAAAGSLYIAEPHGLALGRNETSDALVEQPAELVSTQPMDEGAVLWSVARTEHARRQRSRPRGHRFGSALLAFSLASGLGVVDAIVIADPASAADTVLCSGSSYSACTSLGYSDHGYDSGTANNTSYWGAYPGHNCTNYAAYVETQNGVGKPSFSLGDAYQWYSEASGHVTESTTTPVVGSVAWWGQNQGGVGSDGHVAYVEGVSGSTGNYTITISEDAYPSGPFDWRSISEGDARWPGGFIYFDNISSSGSNGGSAPSGQGSGVGTAAYKGSDHLVVNQPLYQNQYIESPDGMFVLELQGDGNLVEYGPGFQPVWASNTSGANIGYVVMQPDGNLVGYTPDGRTALWSNGEPNSGNNNTLYMQPDGNLVEYTSSGSAVWSDGKNRPGYYPPAYKGGNELVTNEGLYQNQYIRSSNGEHFVLLQPDGGAVVYGPGYHVVGGFGPQASGAGYVVLQPDGNFVEYQPNGQNAIWGNGESGSGGNYMVIQDDGNFVEYQSNGQVAVWGSGTAGEI